MDTPTFFFLRLSFHPKHHNVYYQCMTSNTLHLILCTLSSPPRFGKLINMFMNSTCHAVCTCLRILERSWLFIMFIDTEICTCKLCGWGRIRLILWGDGIAGLGVVRKRLNSLCKQRSSFHVMFKANALWSVLFKSTQGSQTVFHLDSI